MFRLVLFMVLLQLTEAISFSSHIDSTKRNVTSFYNCSSESVDLVYTRAVGKHDTLHYISSAVGIPSLLVLKTEKNVSCTVECDAIKPNSTGKHIHCDKVPTYAYSISFSRIFEYRDPMDTADMESKKVEEWKTIDMNSLTFDNVTENSDLSKNTFTWKVTVGNNDTLEFDKGGSISFGVEIYSEEGRNEELPHLLYNGNGSHVFFTMHNVIPSYDQSRFALELQLIIEDQDKKSEYAKIVTHKSLDDEHTPGVFDVLTWSKEDDMKKEAAYIQWKPVCYVDKKPSIQHSTVVKSYESVQETLDKSTFSVALAYFGDNMNVSATNVSFGLSKDKFYNSAKYIKWTFAVGYGSPPQDQISGLIITIISVGLGIPVLLILIGSVCACVRKRNAAKESDFSSSSYSAIQ